MNTQKMVTTHMVNTDEECVSIRKCSLPESKVRIIYKVLGYDEKPFIRKKSVVPQLNLEKYIRRIQGISSGCAAMWVK